MLRTFTVISLLFFSIYFVNAQKSISAKLIDATTQNPVGFATITLNKKQGVISNENGEFSMTIKKQISPKDSIHISCLGYDKTVFAVASFAKDTLYLSPKTFDLDEVFISNKTYTAEEIIQLVKDSLQTNYDFGFVKRKLFFRESNYVTINKSEFKLKTSTISEINQEFVDSLLASIPRKNNEHTEILGELYGKTKSDAAQKLDILKASELIDKKNEATFENYEKRFNKILKTYVRPDSYFKIKSGWFSTKEEIDSSMFESGAPSKEEQQTAEFLAKKKENEQKRKEGFLNYRKQFIHSFENNTFLNADNKLNFLEKSHKYVFELLDFTLLNDAFVYKLRFTPKRRADFEGVLYINTEDFAILRVDYNNVRHLRNFNLLGISFKQNLREGTIIFDKNTNGKYVLKFMDERQGAIFGVKRPLKIVEKNKNVKGRRKQNEIAGKAHFIVNTIQKNEYIAFETASISENDFNAFIENPEVTPTELTAYDPNFWGGYDIIEPNQALKEFKILED